MDVEMSRQAVDLAGAVVVVPPHLSRRERQAVTMLVEEVERRTLVRWEVVGSWPASPQPVVAVGLVAALPSPGGLRRMDPALEGAAEGYRLWTDGEGVSAAIYVGGNDSRGLLFGVGHLLRTLRMERGAVTLPPIAALQTAPRYRLRGHQLGYRDKTNSYCGWDLDQWEQYVRDLAVFGTNAIELIPPRSDDNADSVHFPRPPLETMRGVSGIADAYGLDVWVWFPAMEPDYTDPQVVGLALQEWAEVFRALPRIDAVFVPGGDPGHVRPRELMALLEKQVENLHRFHPAAGMWVSPQGFTQEWMDEFISVLRQDAPAWLSGVVFGPWIHMAMAEFRTLVPDAFPIRNYPDITHNFSCQYPVPDWDVSYALTEGRESINPRPRGQEVIFRHSQPGTVGFLTYSEGCNDDVNKFIWSGLGWDPNRDVADILRDYCRYFIGERYGAVLAQGVLALERNWQGPLATNSSVDTTLQQFRALESAASPRDLKNWRFQQLLYRAYYDAYVRSRLLCERGLEEQALDWLRRAPEIGSQVAIDQAEQLLDTAVTHPVGGEWRGRLFQLAEALFQSIHMQLSVPLYDAQAEVRGANLDGIDYPLNNRLWLKERFSELCQLSDEPARLAGIRDLLHWTDPGPGGYYDDLTNLGQWTHLVAGPGFDRDPALLLTPHRQFPYHKDPAPLRLAWRSQTGTLGDVPFEMRYQDLDPEARYRVRIVYSDLDPRAKVRLEANYAVEVHPFISRPVPRKPLEFGVPIEATRKGELTLRWYREPGLGGAGRGCAVSEVWLLRA